MLEDQYTLIPAQKLADRSIGLNVEEVEESFCIVAVSRCEDHYFIDLAHSDEEFNCVRSEAKPDAPSRCVAFVGYIEFIVETWFFFGGRMHKSLVQVDKESFVGRCF